jgi:hypothetical protein
MGLNRSRDPQHAVWVLLAQLLPRFQAADMRGAAWILLQWLAGAMSSKRLRSAAPPPELTAAVGGALAARFPGCRWPVPAAAWMVGGAHPSYHGSQRAGEAHAPSGDGRRPGHRPDALDSAIGPQLDSCLCWWLCSEEGEAGLQRAKVSLSTAACLGRGRHNCRPEQTKRSAL